MVEPTLLGTVQDVSGGTVSVVLDADTASGLAFVDGHGYRIGQVGTFVRIPIGYVELYGVVSTVGAGAVPEHARDEQPYGNRWMTVQLVGETNRGEDFQRGLSQHPTIGDRVHLLAERDLERLYGSQDAPDCLRVGRLANAESIPALLNVDRLVTRHSAVVGSTGSGKSSTVARLLRAVVSGERFGSARILVFDMHGEYASALKPHAAVFAVPPLASAGAASLNVPYWAMSFDELLPLTFGDLGDRERAAVQEKIVGLKAEALSREARAGVDARSLTVDSPVPFSIHRLWFDLHRLINATHTAPATGQSAATEALVVDENGEPVEPGNAMELVPPAYQPQRQGSVYLSGSPLNLAKPLEALRARLGDPRFAFLFKPGDLTVDENGEVQADLDHALRRWLGAEQPIAIFDLSGVPPSVLQALLGALLRIIYDALFWGRRLSEGGRERPLMIVLEEAHSYLGPQETGLASQVVKRVVREGRKYGVGAMIVSQRPSEVDPTVLSQCGTLVALRLGNARDRGMIGATVSETFAGFLDALPVLRTGEAIAVGEAVHLPMRLLIEPLPPNERPDSDDPKVYEPRRPGGWNRDREPSDYTEVVHVWRAQDPRPPRQIDD